MWPHDSIGRKSVNLEDGLAPKYTDPKLGKIFSLNSHLVKKSLEKHTPHTKKSSFFFLGGGGQKKSTYNFNVS